MRTKKIRQIIKAFERSSLEHLEVTKGKMKISMQKPIGTAHLLSSHKSTIERVSSSESH